MLSEKRFKNTSNRLTTFCCCNFDISLGVMLLHSIQTVQVWIRTRTWLFSLSVCLTIADAHFLIMFGHNSFGRNLFSNIPAFSHRLCSRPLMSSDVILSPFHEMKTYRCNRTYFALNIIDKHWHPFELWLIQHQWWWTICVHSLMIFYIHANYTVVIEFSLLKFCHCHICCNSRPMSTREMIF